MINILNSTFKAFKAMGYWLAVWKLKPQHHQAPPFGPLSKALNPFSSREAEWFELLPLGHMKSFFCLNNFETEKKEAKIENCW